MKITYFVAPPFLNSTLAGRFKSLLFLNLSVLLVVTLNKQGSKGDNTCYQERFKMSVSQVGHPSLMDNNIDTIGVPTDTEFTIEPEPSGTRTLDFPVSRILIMKDASTHYGGRNGKEDKTEDERQKKLLLHSYSTTP